MKRYKMGTKMKQLSEFVSFYDEDRWTLNNRNRSGDIFLIYDTYKTLHCEIYDPHIPHIL